MSKKSFILSDFQSLFSKSDSISQKPEAGKWEVIPYVSTACEGAMLYAREGIEPTALQLDLKLDGWHRISVGLFYSGEDKGGISLRLSSDKAATWFRSTKRIYNHWMPNEVCEEFFWKCADLSGKSLTIAQAGTTAPCSLMWLHFEKMSETEITEHKKDRARTDCKRMHVHSDLDWLEIARSGNSDDYNTVIEAFAESDAEIASLEVYWRLSDLQNLAFNNIRTRAHAAFLQDDEKHFKNWLELAHERNLKLYAAHRMSLANFILPHDLLSVSRLKALKKFPQFCCIDRDGEKLAILSYAYKEVQDYMIDEFIKLAAIGFDGISLIMHRGICLAFEQPIIEAFKEKFGEELDPRILPLTDERLKKVRCEIFSGFMRRLRAALDELSCKNNLSRKSIHIIGCYGLEDNRMLGLDLETWAKEALIDSVAPGNMRVWESGFDPENSDKDHMPVDLKDERNSSLLSIEKYRAAKKNCIIGPLRREHYQNIELMCSNAADYKRLTEKYGLKVYAEIPWELTETPNDLRKYAKRLYDAGYERISAWDAYHKRVLVRSEWQVVSRLGHREELDRDEDTRRNFRMLSVDGLSMSSYHPSWRG